MSGTVVSGTEYSGSRAIATRIVKIMECRERVVVQNDGGVDENLCVFAKCRKSVANVRREWTSPPFATIKRAILNTADGHTQDATPGGKKKLYDNASIYLP